MFAFIEGTIAYCETDAVVVAANGIGYRVAVARQPGSVGDVVRLFLAEVIREDRFDLYGFATRDDLTMFHLLLGIDGVGPKSALKIMASGSVETLRANIQKGDIGFLTAISGVGKKTAQKILLELRGVLVSDVMNGEHADVAAALESLGYRRSDLEGVLQHIVGETLEEKVKSALKMLSRQ